MVRDISQDKNLALFAELNDGSYGTIGGYCEDGFPIYYANEKIAEMLGYKDVEEFVDGIHGLVLNTIHPDDLVKVTKDLNNGNYYEGMTYRTTYRMPKKAGSWIWTIDKGKVIRASDGRLAIISVCVD